MTTLALTSCAPDGALAPVPSPSSAPEAPAATPVPPAPEPPDSAPLIPEPPPTTSVEVLPPDVDALLASLGCLEDGATLGAWTVRFAGYGCAAVGAGSPTGQVGSLLALSPAVATSPDATHAGLVLGPTLSSADGATRFRARVHTARQLRTGSAPNPWEVAWVVWHYADDAHFYYFIPKPNGWELGKRDPAYPGGQRFLATGTDRRFPVGAWYDVAVAQRGDTITVSVDGQPVVTFVDGERPYTAGSVGLYSEDAAVVARASLAE